MKLNTRLAVISSRYDFLFDDSIEDVKKIDLIRETVKINYDSDIKSIVELFLYIDQNSNSSISATKTMIALLALSEAYTSDNIITKTEANNKIQLDSLKHFVSMIEECVTFSESISPKQLISNVSVVSDLLSSMISLSDNNHVFGTLEFSKHITRFIRNSIIISSVYLSPSKKELSNLYKLIVLPSISDDSSISKIDFDLKYNSKQLSDFALINCSNVLLNVSRNNKGIFTANVIKTLENITSKC